MGFLEIKNPFKSVTIWGGILAALPLIVQGTDKLLSTGVLPEEVAIVVSGIGGFAAMLGRYIAKKQIKF